VPFFCVNEAALAIFSGQMSSLSIQKKKFNNSLPKSGLDHTQAVVKFSGSEKVLIFV
jgi:hypothetical protein